MHAISSKRRARQSGVSLLLTSMALVFIVPMLGLMIDVGILYSVRSRLQSSVDGSAIAAARALNLGQTTSAQSDSAKQNAVDWFYANFPVGNWNTTGTNMSTSTVQVYDDPNNPNLRIVDISASTVTPTFFMRWFGANSVTVTATGTASRRDVVAMLVLDRSGSMCSPSSAPCSATSSTPCKTMVQSAKAFTGQFAAGRDQIGLLTFSDGTYLHTAPTTNFQSTLGYTNSYGTSNGQIDQINCNGGTNTPAAVSLAYNEIVKKNLPGALNFVVLETDGMPNTLAFNWWDSANNVAGINAASNCQDKNGKMPGTGTGRGGWTTLASKHNWTSGYNMNTGGTGYMANIPAGVIGAVASSDPGSTSIMPMSNPWQTGANASSGNGNSINLGPTGCKFTTSGFTTNTTDLNWVPAADIYGNSLKPANAYKSVTLSGGHVDLTGVNSTDWTNFHNGALNATDNAAYVVRNNQVSSGNADWQIFFYSVGLGGNGVPPDPVLLQRMANDPNGDTLHPSSPNYTACSTEATCVHYNDQPQGFFVYANNATELNQAFLTLASQILRFSH